MLQQIQDLQDTLFTIKTHSKSYKKRYMYIQTLSIIKTKVLPPQA
jgi:hypothetical protein